jgi:hypothetical protein
MADDSEVVVVSPCWAAALASGATVVGSVVAWSDAVTDPD